MRNVVSIALLVAGTAVQAGAQETMKLQLEPGTELTISGTSTLKAFTCRTSKLDATLIVDKGYTKDLTKIARPIVSVRVEIPAKSLECGNKTMNGHMYKALNADKNPTIVYAMSGYDVFNGTISGFAAKTIGTLAISGREKVVAMDVKAERVEETRATAKGEQSILLTDFGIKPPKLMLGTLKVGNEIKIKFNLKAGPSMIASVNAAINGDKTQ